ncbi:hypothetical protein Dimus_026314 [Dionaea muscipula]
MAPTAAMLILGHHTTWSSSITAAAARSTSEWQQVSPSSSSSSPPAGVAFQVVGRVIINRSKRGGFATTKAEDEADSSMDMEKMMEERCIIRTYVEDKKEVLSKSHVLRSKSPVDPKTIRGFNWF